MQRQDPVRAALEAGEKVQPEHVAEVLRCNPRDVKPCLCSAFNRRREVHLARGPGMQFETLRFVGLMLLDMGRANFSLPAAKRLLLLFANAKGFPRERAEHLIRWTEGNPWRAPGCRGRAAGDLCIGRENCAYYRGKRYEKHTRDRPDSDCQTFYARGWPKWVAEREHRLYRALCELEKARGIPAGGSLFFTFGDGRDVGMGPDTQRRALADLEARGLVRVVDKGKPRTAGEHVRPRTVERVVPIPYAR